MVSGFGGIGGFDEFLWVCTCVLWVCGCVYGCLGLFLVFGCGFWVIYSPHKVLLK